MRRGIDVLSVNTFFCASSILIEYGHRLYSILVNMIVINYKTNLSDPCIDPGGNARNNRVRIHTNLL